MHYATLRTLDLIDLERVVSETLVEACYDCNTYLHICTVRTWDFAADSLRSSSLCSL